MRCSASAPSSAQAMNELCFDDLDGPVARLHTAPVTPSVRAFPGAGDARLDGGDRRAGAARHGGHRRSDRRGSGPPLEPDGARASSGTPAHAPHPASRRAQPAAAPQRASRRRRADHDAVRRPDGERGHASCKWHRKLGDRSPRATMSPTSRPTRRWSRSNSPRSGVLAEILAEEGAVVRHGSVDRHRAGGSLMRILLSHFVHPDDALEREARERRGGARSCRRARSAPGSRCRRRPRADRRHHPFPAEHHRGRSPGRLSARAGPRALRRRLRQPRSRGLGRRGRRRLQRAGLRHVRSRRPRHCADAGPDPRHRAPITTPCRSDPAAGWSHQAAPAVRACGTRSSAIVGLGRIGLAAAMRARGFGMQIAFYDPYLPSGMEIAVGARRCATPRRSDGGSRTC